MAKQLMNEADRFLLDHWTDAHLLEESMKGVRAKYLQLFERVVEAVEEKHPELDLPKVALTQSWTEGQIGFGRKSWPRDDPKTPSGFWVQNVRLEFLTAEDTDDPFAAIWLAKKANLDFDAARNLVNHAAKELLAAEEMKEWIPEEEGPLMIWRPISSKAELLAGLSEGDGEAFVGLLISQFDVMALFVPVLDKVFRECLLKE